jgi:hypothetical protein
MKRPGKPLFLARIPYRRRRLRDAARLLPVLGAFLMILPWLWSPPGTGMRLTSGDVVYFFLIWIILVLVAAAFAPGLTGSDQGPEEDED